MKSNFHFHHFTLNSFSTLPQYILDKNKDKDVQDDEDGEGEDEEREFTLALLRACVEKTLDNIPTLSQEVEILKMMAREGRGE